MLKSQIVQLVADAVGEKFALRTVALHIENAYNTIVGQVFVQNANQLDFYAKPYEAEVHHGKQTYAKVPVAIIQNADNAKGVRAVYTEEMDTRFTAAPTFVIDSSCDSTMIGYVFYAVKHDRVLFKNLPKEVKKVVMDLVIPFHLWDDADDIPIPGGVADNIIALSIQTWNADTAAHTNAYKTK